LPSCRATRSPCRGRATLPVPTGPRARAPSKGLRASTACHVASTQVHPRCAGCFQACAWPRRGPPGSRRPPPRYGAARRQPHPRPSCPWSSAQPLSSSYLLSHRGWRIKSFQQWAVPPLRRPRSCASRTECGDFGGREEVTSLPDQTRRPYSQNSIDAYTFAFCLRWSGKVSCSKARLPGLPARTSRYSSG
jgi:hypothetical protein